MPKVFGNLQKETKLARNPFDLSHYDVMTAKFGVIRPVFMLETLPGDHIEISPSNYLRTMQPLQTDAFVKASQNLDFYFVPFQQLMSAFPEFYSKVNDPQSYADRNATSFDSVPYFDVLELMLISFNVSTDCRNFGLPVPPSEELYDMLTSEYYLYVYKTWFFGVYDLLDLCGYGNYLPFLEDLALYVDAPDIYSDAGFIDLVQGIRQLTQNQFNALYNKSRVTGSSPVEYLKVSAFRIMAYQRVWYNYFRNHYYDINNVNYTFIINADWLADYDDFNLLNSLTSASIVEMFQVRYRQWKKDLVTGLLPSAQFGDVAVASINSDLNVVASSNLGQASFEETGNITANQNGVSVSNRYVTANLLVNTSAAGVSVLAIRTAEALQRWKENTLRAGVKTTNQFKAHFGVEPRYVRDWYPDFLGSCDGSVNITSVTSNSETGSESNGLLGSVAGNIASALSHKEIKFDAQDFGVIIGCYSILPDAQYNSFGIDEHNVHLTPDDFYLPEFQNVGLAPVYARNVDVVGRGFGNVNHVLGYAPRYLEYKYKMSKVHGLLYSQTSLRSLVPDDVDNTNVTFQGQFNHWAMPRFFTVAPWDITDQFLYDLNRFYVHPNVMDSVFYAEDDGTPASDQLILAFNFDVKAVRPISVIGLPQF